MQRPSALVRLWLGSCLDPDRFLGVSEDAIGIAQIKRTFVLCARL